MMRHVCNLLFIALLWTAGGGLLMGQSAGDTPEKHVAAAKAAAGQEHLGLLARVCADPEPAPAAPAENAQPRRQGPPPASQWHVEPAKVFDNLYFVGQK